MVRVCDVPDIHPALDRFVRVILPVDGIAYRPNGIESGESQDHDKGRNDHPLPPTKRFQSFEDLSSHELSILSVNVSATALIKVPDRECTDEIV